MEKKSALTSSLFEMVSVMGQKANGIVKREFDISFTFFHALAILSAHPSLTQHQLALKLRFSDAAVSRLVAKMQQNGYVKIVTDPAHKRRRLVSITNDGQKIAAGCGQRLEQSFIKDVMAAGVDPQIYHEYTKAIKRQLKKGTEYA